MTARRTPRTKAPAADAIDVFDALVANEEVVEVLNTPPVVNDAPPANNRKYFSHANCSHPRKGEAGKAARAKCRADIRKWLAAEEEANAPVDVAV